MTAVELETIGGEMGGTVPSDATPRQHAVITATRVVYATTVLWAVGFSVVAALEQRWFLLRRYDLGNFTQAIWSTAHGHLLQVTEIGGTQVSRLGIHVDPVLLFLVPIWKLWPSPVMLLVVQAVALAAGAPPLYWLARKYLSSEQDAALIAGAYLLCPAVGWNAAQEFHAVALAVPLLIAAVWFLDTGRLRWFVVAAAGAVLCQEQIGFVVAGLGIWYAWRSRRIFPGVAIAASAALVSALEFGVVLPHFSSGSPYTGRYASIGGSFGGMLHTLFTDPLTILTHLLQPADLLGVGLLAIPVLALCFRSTLILAAVPQFALIMLSDRANDLDFSGQTVLPIIPFIYVGTVFALSRRDRTAHFGAAHVLVASIGIAAFFGPLSALARGLPSSAHMAAAQHAVALVPPSAAVSTTNHLGAHLATRSHLYVFPVIKNATWVVVDASDPYLPDMTWLRTRHGIQVGTRDLYFSPKLMHRVLRRLNASPLWKRVYTSDGISVFNRRST